MQVSSEQAKGDRAKEKHIKTGEVTLAGSKIQKGTPSLSGWQ